MIAQVFRTSFKGEWEAAEDHPKLTSPSVARNLERIAWLMDRAIKVPGTRISIGLDALLGLFPVGGDLLTGIVQAGVVILALYHYRVPKVVGIRMMGNVLLDIGVGAIPLLGDLFDVAFKANTRNLRLLEPYRQDRKPGEVVFGPGGEIVHSRCFRSPFLRFAPSRYALALPRGDRRCPTRRSESRRHWVGNRAPLAILEDVETAGHGDEDRRQAETAGLDHHMIKASP